nr:PREDICTED: uncharacterized serine-rich protein C215.13-like isoform X2 [Bemisia tabaci]
MKRRRCKQTSTNRTFTLKSKDSSHLASQQCYDSSVAPELNPQVNVGRITDSAQSSNSPATCSTCQSPHLSGFFVSSSPLETLSSKESCHVPECSQVPLSLSSESFSVQNGINRQDTYTINYNGVKTRTKEKEGPESKVAQLDSKCVANSRKRKFPRSLSDTILTIKHQCCVHGNIIPLEFLPRQKPLIEGNSNFKVVQHNESDRNSLVDESPEANERHFERSSGASSSQVSVIKSSLVAEPTYKHNTKAISRASSTCRKVSVKVTKLSSRDISAYTTSLSTHSSSPAVSHKTEATSPKSKASTNTSSPVGGENSMHTSSSPVVKQEVETQLTEDSSSDEREKSYSTETIECVEAGLMHISPPISENLISAICGRCNKLIPYGTAETMVVSEETMWPNNKVPLCATKSCNGRLLYWGIFKAQLMLKTIKGEYLIAQINDPNAEKFFGCSAAQFFEDPAHKKRIQKRISELLLLNKGAEDIIMKKYTLIKIRNGNELRIRILHTSLFEP